MQDPGHPAETPTGDENQQIQDEHLQTMGRLLLGIAHEMNTPLGVVLSTCDGQRRCLEKMDAILAKPALDADDPTRWNVSLVEGVSFTDGRPFNAEAVKANDLVVTSALSGNRNFEGRINPYSKANYLASPPLVVAYALAGTVDIDLYNEPIGAGKDGLSLQRRQPDVDLNDSSRDLIAGAGVAVPVRKFEAPATATPSAAMTARSCVPTTSFVTPASR